MLYKALVKNNIKLTSKLSNQNIRHIDLIPLQDQKSDYEPGDSIAIYMKDNRLNKLRPRLYSISSSPLAHKNIISITVKLDTYTDENENYFEGVCSSYLTHLQKDQMVAFDIKTHKSFRLPENNNIPVIMIGPGVGFAPFRSFIFQRKAQNAEGENWLLFGTRTSKDDFIYKDELLTLQKQNCISLDVAFSRDDPNNKVYVQDIIYNKKDIFTKLILKQNAYLYICGDKKNMYASVMDTIYKILEENNIQNPKDFMQDLKKKEKRFATSVY